MTEKKEVYDGLKCGNCGYDGGESHLKEKMEWQKQLHNATRVSDTTKQTRWVVSGFVVVLSVLICAVTYNSVQPVQFPPQPQLPTPPTDTAIKYEQLAKMYKDCSLAAAQAHVDNRDKALEACNLTFKEKMQ